MKKLLVCLLVVGMMSAFSGCGDKPDKEPVQSSVTETSNTESTVEETTVGEQKDETGFSLGVIDGKTYENKFIGIGCTIADDWTFYDEEQIKSLNNIAGDIAGDEYKNMIEQANLVYDMYATSGDMVSNINVNMEKLNDVQNKTLDVKKNYELVAPVLVSTFENMGCTDVKNEIKDIEIDGKTVPVVYNSAKLGDAVIYQCLLGIKCDGYLANIALTATSEDDLNKLVSTLYFI